VIVRVTKQHLSFGQFKRGRCPLSLAFYDAFDIRLEIDKKTLVLSPHWLTLVNYHGSIVYSIKLPDSAQHFYKKYYDHYIYGGSFNKIPKPFEFEIGEYYYYDGCRIDLLKRVMRDIQNWDGSEPFYQDD